MRHNRMLITPLVLLSILLTSAIAQEEPIAVEISESEKERSVERVGDLLRERYVFPDIGDECAKHIEKCFDEGVFDGIQTASEFARALTRELQSISHDKHMRVRPAPVRRAPEGTPSPIFDAYQQRARMESLNYGVARAEILEGNIGVLDIRFFPSVALARPTVSAAMKVLENVDALIVDLRRNGGGNPGLIQYYCSYFFSERTHLNSLYWREGDRTQEFWTLDDIDGRKLPDVPIFVLTSNQTFSGGEEFAYNLKTRGRGVLIGETTGGGANPGGTFPVNELLAVFIPTGRAINPVTKTNWEGTGVEPDKKVGAEEAMSIALTEAETAAEAYRIARRSTVEELASSFDADMSRAKSKFEEGLDGEGAAIVENIMTAGTTKDLLNEMAINMLGYQYLQQEDLRMAIAIFQANTLLYPESSNAYDSLGEALMNAGRTEESIRNYRRSLELDPSNENARRMIQDLGGSTE